jgi:hypothetical protein
MRKQVAPGDHAVRPLTQMAFSFLFWRPRRAFVNGWGRLDLSDHHTSLGLPVIGSSFIKAVNPSAAPGVSGTYGLTAEHWYKR